MSKTTSTGGPTEYYNFPEGATTLNDLIELKRMSFAQGNIFKAAFRLGAKADVSEAYDLRKIVYYALRMLKLSNSEIQWIMARIDAMRAHREQQATTVPDQDKDTAMREWLYPYSRR